MRPIVWITLLAALLTVIRATPAHAQEARRFDPMRTYKVAADGAPARGPADAPVTIVEFSDFYCRYCINSQRTLEQVEALYRGRVRLVFRHNPLDIEEGTLAAEAAMAAHAQGRFWDMHERLFAEPGAVERHQVEGFARELGLDMVRFRRDLDGHRHRAVIERDARAAAALGIASTPMFFVNGRPIKGSQGASSFRRVIDEELARAAALTRRGVKARDVYRTVVATGDEQGSLGEVDEYALAAPPDADERWRVRIDPARARGPATALVTMVVFLDFECPACVHSAPIVEEMRARFGDDLRVVLRHFPLDMHLHAELAAQAFEAAAAQGKGWEMHDAMIAHGAPLGREALDELAAAIDVDMDRFRADLDKRRYRAAIVAETARAAALGIRATPSLLINGRLVAGMPPAEMLAARIDGAREEAKAMVAAGIPRTQVLDALLKNATRVEP